MTTKSPLPGLNILVMGAGGSGKTYATAAIAEAFPHLEVCYLMLENGFESVMQYYSDKGKPLPHNIFLAEQKPVSAGFAALADEVARNNRLSEGDLLKINDPNKSKYDSMEKFLRLMHNYTDTRTGRVLGSVDSWGTGRVLVIDSLTGLSLAAKQAIAGGRFATSQSDWGRSQNALEYCLRVLVDGCRCHLVVLAHVEREVDQVSGGVKIMPSTLGKALPPKLSPMFSEVLYSERKASNYLWSTNNTQVDTKTRSLGLGEFPQSYKTLFDSWEKKGGLYEPNTPASA